MDLRIPSTEPKNIITMKSKTEKNSNDLFSVDHGSAHRTQGVGRFSVYGKVHRVGNSGCG